MNRKDPHRYFYYSLVLLFCDVPNGSMVYEHPDDDAIKDSLDAYCLKHDSIYLASEK